MSHPGSKLSIWLGVFVSLALGWQLTSLVMSGGVGQPISLQEFINSPASILYVLIRVALCFSYWFMAGTNNKTYIVCWIIGDIVGSYLYSVLHHYFLYVDKNIYVLNCISFFSVIPLYLICRYRLLILTWIFSALGRISSFHYWAVVNLNKLSVTKSITRFDMWLKLLLFIEVVGAIVLNSIALHYRLPSIGSMSALFMTEGIPNLFYFQSNVVSTWGLGFFLLLVASSISDRKSPDSFVKISKSTKEKVIKKFNSRK